MAAFNSTAFSMPTLHITEGAIDEAWLNLDFVRRARGDYLAALECFRRALTIDPRDTDAQDALLDIEQVLFKFPREPVHPGTGDGGAADG